MPSKQDFQKLVDWCAQPSTNPYFRHVVGAHLLKEDSGEGGVTAAYEGFLTFAPPHSAHFLPEHFSGSLDYVGTEPYRVTVGMAIGDTYATAGFNWSFNGRYDELDVQDATQEAETVVFLNFGQSSGNYWVYAYLYPSLRYVNPGSF